jgi:hypothetical protein
MSGASCRLARVDRSVKSCCIPNALFTFDEEKKAHTGSAKFTPDLLELYNTVIIRITPVTFLNCTNARADSHGDKLIILVTLKGQVGFTTWWGQVYQSAEV